MFLFLDIKTHHYYFLLVPMSSLVLASISPSRVSGLAIDFSSSQEIFSRNRLYSGSEGISKVNLNFSISVVWYEFSHCF